MDRVEVIRRLTDTAERMIAHCSAPERDLTKSYAAGKWTVRQILAHVADCEFINYWRFCRAVAEPGANVEVFDEGRWARGLDYSTRPAEVSRELFAGSRHALIHYARTLTDEQLAGACLHAEKGRMSGDAWLALNADHVDHHLGQIEAARQGKTWTPSHNPDSWRYGAGKKP